MLQATDVSFGYRGASAGAPLVVDGVTLRVERGASVALLGPNGAGKTTLLKLLAGMLQPRAGQVTLDGRPISGLTRREVARRLAVVPQETRTPFDFTVIEMVLMGRYPHLGTFELEGGRDLAIAREALSATGTAAFESRPFSTLSGGEKQRVVIAGALAQSAEALLLDEPTAALDLKYQFEIVALLRRLNAGRGTTVIVSTHDLNLAAALCDRLVLLRGGRIMAQGPTVDVLTPENVRALYEVDADVQYHERAGRLMVVPLGRSR